MRVYVETLLPFSVERVWQAIQSSALLAEASAPLLTIPTIEPAIQPERWTEPQRIRLRTFLFGSIALGESTIEVQSIDPQSHIIETLERDQIVRRWRHRMAIRPAARNQSLYSDTVDIEAGFLTPLVWAFARLLYRHRHRRWRTVIEGAKI